MDVVAQCMHTFVRQCHPSASSHRQQLVQHFFDGGPPCRQVAYVLCFCHAVLRRLQVHGKLYKSLFGEEPCDVIGSGFAIRKGQWCWKSASFNTWLPAGIQERRWIRRSRCS
eukprot:GHRQ01022861.1.p3 GENE.GHRQ01022861.1~~GHRQ01022861.1.p3  ORF type:complete len:112 (-),score=20.38 GHRQ01022861.1:559-894(-)